MLIPRCRSLATHQAKQFGTRCIPRSPPRMAARSSSMDAAAGPSSSSSPQPVSDWQHNIITDPARALAIAAAARTVAVLGIKTEHQSGQPAFFVAEYLQQAGVRVVPVPVFYPEVTEILGQPVFRKVADIPGGPVDILDVFRWVHLTDHRIHRCCLLGHSTGDGGSGIIMLVHALSAPVKSLPHVSIFSWMLCMPPNHAGSPLMCPPISQTSWRPGPRLCGSR